MPCWLTTKSADALYRGGDRAPRPYATTCRVADPLYGEWLRRAACALMAAEQLLLLPTLCSTTMGVVVRSPTRAARELLATRSGRRHGASTPGQAHCLTPCRKRSDRQPGARSGLSNPEIGLPPVHPAPRPGGVAPRFNVFTKLGDRRSGASSIASLGRPTRVPGPRSARPRRSVSPHMSSEDLCGVHRSDRRPTQELRRDRPARGRGARWHGRRRWRSRRPSPPSPRFSRPTPLAPLAVRRPRLVDLDQLDGERSWHWR